MKEKKSKSCLGSFFNEGVTTPSKQGIKTAQNMDIKVGYLTLMETQKWFFKVMEDNSWF
jgi:hypothetical protein